MQQEGHSNPSISVIIVNWRAGDLLKQCVRAIETASEPDSLVREVIVVDNSCDDNSLAGLEAGSLNLQIICNHENVGFAKACNQGSCLATGAYLLFLNPDCEINRTALQQPLLFLESNDMHAACGIQLRDEEGAIARSCTRLPRAYSFILNAIGFQYLYPKASDGFHLSNWPHDEDRDVEHIIGAFYFIRADIFRETGMFDERFIVYLEDLDLSARLAKMGWKIRYLTSAHAVHVGGGASSKALAARLYYSLSSRLRYSRKHHSIIGFILVAILTMCFEPVIRAAYSCFSAKALGIHDITKGYAWLWMDFLRARAGRTTAVAR